MKARSIVVIFLFTIVCASVSAASASDANSLGRTWEYASLTTVFSPEWSLTAIAGHRYEFYRSQGDNIKTFMYEFFIGPNYKVNFAENFTFKCSLWYYYMGFDMRDSPLDEYMYSHNANLIPSIEYRFRDFTFSNRVIVHGKFYADNDQFTSSSQKRGFSLLCREMLKVSYKIVPDLSVSLADEVFFGLIEDGETNGIRKGEPWFEENGFSKNRLYAGLTYKISPLVSVTPQYILETNYDPENDYKLKDKTHYIFLSVDFVLVTF